MIFHNTKGLAQSLNIPGPIKVYRFYILTTYYIHRSAWFITELNNECVSAVHSFILRWITCVNVVSKVNNLHSCPSWGILKQWLNWGLERKLYIHTRTHKPSLMARNWLSIYNMWVCEKMMWEYAAVCAAGSSDHGVIAVWWGKWGGRDRLLKEEPPLRYKTN